MPVSAAQLEADVVINDGDLAKEILLEISDMVDGLIGKFTDMPQLNIGESFAGVADAIAEIGGVGEEVASGLEDATTASVSFMDSLNMISSSLQELGSNIGGVVSGRLDSFVSGIQNIASNINDAVSGPIESFIGGIQDIASNISDTVSGPLGNLTSGVQNVANTLSDAASGSINSFMSGIQRIGSTISDAVSGPIDAFTSKVQAVVSTVGDFATNAFNNFTSSISSFASDISEAASGPLADFISGVQSLGTNIMDVASGPLNSLKSNISSAMSSMGDFASEAGGNVVSGISDFAGSLGDAGQGLMDMVGNLGMGIMNLQMLGMQADQAAQSLLGPAVSAETMATSFDTLMGSTKKANDELNKLDAFAAKTPFKTMDIDAEAAKLLGFGVNASKIIPDITSIGDALSAVGKGSTANLDSIVGIFGKIQLAGKLTGADMMQFSNDGINAWGILEQQTGKTQAQLTAMISKGLFPASTALDDLTKGIEKSPLYSGGMAKQSATTAGLISTLASNWNQLMVAFGTPIIKALEGSLSNLGDALAAPAFKEFAGAVGQGIVNTIKAITTNTQIATPIMAALGAMILVTVVPAVWSAAAGMIALTWPILLVGAAVAALVAIFMHFYDTNSGFKSFIDNFVGGLKLAWTEISSNFMPVLKQIGNVIQTDVMPFLQKIGSFLMATFVPVWQNLVSVWQSQLLPAFKELWTAMQPLEPLLIIIGAIIGGVLLMMFASLIGLVNGLAKGIGAFVTGVATIITGFVQTITGLIQVVTGIVRVIVDIFTLNFKDLGPALGQIWQGILNILGGMLKGMEGLFIAVFGTIWGFVSGFVEGVIGFFVSLYDQLIGHSIIPDMINGIFNWFAQLPGRIGGYAKDMMNEFINAILNGISGVENAVSQVADKIKSFLHFSKPDVGPLADADMWMVDFGNLLSKGLDAQINKISASSLKLATTMAVNLNPVVKAALPSGFSGLPSGLTGLPSGIPSASSQSSQQIVINMPQPVITIDGQKVTKAIGPNIVKSTRVSGPIRSSIS